MKMERTTLYIGLLILALGFFMQSADVSANSQHPPSVVFFSAIQDMPIMPGLHELADQTVMFDKPQGRIIEAVAEIDSVSISATDLPSRKSPLRDPASHTEPSLDKFTRPERQPKLFGSFVFREMDRIRRTSFS